MPPAGPAGRIEELLTVPPPPTADLGRDEHTGALAEVAMMPPPIVGDPWTPLPEVQPSDDHGVA